MNCSVVLKISGIQKQIWVKIMQSISPSIEEDINDEKIEKINISLKKAYTFSNKSCSDSTQAAIMVHISFL